jgi:hypothetical protein
VTGRTKLTSNLISIDTFTTVASTDPNKFDFSVTIAATMPPSSITSKYTESITQTAVIGNLKAQNQARNFMIDTTNAAVTNDDTRISDIILENITTTSITLKEITLEWSGVDATLLTKIQFGLSTLEFIGECPSPCTVDIPDQTILPQSTIGLSYFAFDDIISGTVFTITFTMLDDSEAILDYDTTYLLANAPTNERFTIQAKAQAISILPKL